MDPGQRESKLLSVALFRYPDSFATAKCDILPLVVWVEIVDRKTNPAKKLSADTKAQLPGALLFQVTN